MDKFTYPSIRIPSITDDPNVNNGRIDLSRINVINKGMNTLVKKAVRLRDINR